MNAVCMFLYLMYSGVKREDLVPIVAPTYYTKTADFYMETS